MMIMNMLIRGPISGGDAIFRRGYRISIRGFVRPLVGPSVRRSVRRSITSFFRQAETRTANDLCRVSGLVLPTGGYDKNRAERRIQCHFARSFTFIRKLNKHSIMRFTIIWKKLLFSYNVFRSFSGKWKTHFRKKKIFRKAD